MRRIQLFNLFLLIAALSTINLTGTTTGYAADAFFVVEGQIQKVDTFSCANVSSIPLNECNALAALYNSTNGPAWTNRSGWLQTNTPCSWYGVACTSDRVTTLDLTSNNLQGSLPPAIGELQQLFYLYMGSNALTGSIPAEVGGLTRLIQLSLDSNTLTGAIPATIGNLSDLQALYLYKNQLSGAIPSELGQLIKLQHVDLSFNQLSGSFPASLGNLISLREFYAAQNQLSGPLPAAYGNLINLERLSFHTNQLTGPIPSEWGNMVALTMIDLGSNRLLGTIPTSLANLQDLEILLLWGNQLQGIIPPELGNLVKLRSLGLSDNQLSGTIPSSFSQLTSLEELYLGGNTLTGGIPSGLSQLIKLRVLSLGFNQLNGPLPDWLGSLTELHSLGLGGNQFSGVLPAGIGQLAQLRSLSLWENNLSGEIPQALGNLVQLEEIYLNHNQFTGEIPPSVGNLTSVITLTLNSNQLTGTLPPAISQLQNLRRLHIDDNRLSGALPAELGTLSQLEGLWAHKNQFSGHIPAALGNLNHLQVLHLGENQLSGPLPETLGNLRQLKILILWSNQLSGPIPTSVSYLDNLEELHLSHNQLTGSIPVGLGNLAKLRRLHLDFNLLIGSIPTEIGNLQNLEVLIVWMNQLTGTIPGTLGNLKKLRLLGLSENRLVGSIPSALGNLAALEELHLHTNRLSGAIPPEIGNLGNSLTQLYLHRNSLEGEIPTALTNLTKLEILDLNYNRLSASYAPTVAFLTQKNPDWATTQTTPPTNLNATALSNTVVRLSWTPIAYTDHGGGYELSYGAQAGGPYPQTLMVSNKTTAQYNVGNLTPGQTYYFVMRSHTPPHGLQQNELWSGYSLERTITMPQTATPTPTTTPTATPTPSTTPISGDDAYEPNNSCSQAKPMTVDEIYQEHRFYQPEDVDWVYFSVQANQRYRIEAVSPPGSKADIVAELYESCDGAPLDEWSAAYTLSALLEFEADEDGIIYLRLSNHKPTVYGTDVHYRLSLRRLASEPQVGALIIVNGRYKANDPLQKNIDNVTDRVYDLFQAHSYTNDDIYYLASSTHLPGRDAPATAANLRYAITTWARNRVGPDRALTLYLVDHGIRNLLYLDQPKGESVTPAQLDEWLSELESAVPGVPINVIVEACHSGSFIAPPSSLSKPGRVIITSTNVETVAFTSRHGAHFSDHFLVAMRQGRDLFESFWGAKEVVSTISAKQDPWIDANGNGIPNEIADAAIAAQRGFKFPGTVGPIWPPLITEVEAPPIIANRRGIIQAHVLDNDAVHTVWAVVYPPSYVPPENGPELAPEIQSTILLTAQGNDWYAAEYAGFDEIGIYRIVVHAEDADRLQAHPIVVEVVNGEFLYLPALLK